MITLTKSLGILYYRWILSILKEASMKRLVEPIWTHVSKTNAKENGDVDMDHGCVLKALIDIIESESIQVS